MIGSEHTHWSVDINEVIQATFRQNAEGCVKITEDLARYRAVIAKVRPTLIVECGTHNGGSALWFANTAGCPVITFDVYDAVSASRRLEWGDRVTHRIAGSTSPEAKELVHAAVSADDRVLLVLDSDHSAAHVQAELSAYADIATYIVVEDGVLRWMSQAEQSYYIGNPLDAIETWFPNHPEWVEDTEVSEMSPVTMHPRGWWMKGPNDAR